MKEPDAIKRLEAWKCGSKSRWVKIGKDNGYGASCWEVELHAGDYAVLAAEVNFFECEPQDNVVFVRWCKGDQYYQWTGAGYELLEDDGDWPGLAATIHAAIDKAELLGF